MSDKIEIIANWRKIRILYGLGAAYFLAIGLFINISGKIFWWSLVAFCIPVHFLLWEIFPSKGRNFAQRRANVKNYGPPGLIGLTGFLLVFFGAYLAYALLNMSWIASFCAGTGLSFTFWFLYSFKHISNLEERDEIHII